MKNEKLIEIISQFEIYYETEKKFKEEYQKLYVEFCSAFWKDKPKINENHLKEELEEMVLNNEIQLFDVPVEIRIKNLTLYLYTQNALSPDNYNEQKKLIKMLENDFKYCQKQLKIITDEIECKKYEFFADYIKIRLESVQLMFK